MSKINQLLEKLTGFGVSSIASSMEDLDDGRPMDYLWPHPSEEAGVKNCLAWVIFGLQSPQSSGITFYVILELEHHEELIVRRVLAPRAADGTYRTEQLRAERSFSLSLEDGMKFFKKRLEERNYKPVSSPGLGAIPILSVSRECQE